MADQPQALHTGSLSTPEPPPLDPPSPPSLSAPSSHEAISALVNAQGNSKLAALRLQTSEQLLLAAVSSDPAALAALHAQVRTLTLLSLLDTTFILRRTFLEALPRLSPAASAEAFHSLVTALASLTRPSPPQRSAGRAPDAPDTSSSAQSDTNAASALAALLHTLPREVADAVTYFVEAPAAHSNSNGITSPPHIDD